MTRASNVVPLPLVALAALFAASTAATEPSMVSVDGLLLQGDEPVATVVDVHVVVSDRHGVELFVDDQTSIEVGADGRFRVALELAPVLRELEDGSVDVEVGIVETGGPGPPVVAHVRAGASFHAASALTATSALSASSATTLRNVDGGPISSTALVSRAALASSGGPAVAWNGLANRPAGVDDGDDGNVRSVGAGLRLVGTTLSPGTVEGSMIVDGSVGSAALAPSTLTATQIAGLTSADFADGGLGGADFAARAFASSDVAGNRPSVLKQPPGCALPGALTTSTKCPPVACATAGQFKGCSDGVCVTSSGADCTTVSVGKLIFAP